MTTRQRRTSMAIIPLPQGRGIFPPRSSSPQPILDESPRDRVAARQAERVVVLMRENEAALEPARVLELAMVDTDLAVARPRMEAQHDRGRKRPGLRRMVGDLVDADSGLLEDLARHRLFEALAGL